LTIVHKSNIPVHFIAIQLHGLRGYGMKKLTLLEFLGLCFIYFHVKTRSGVISMALAIT